MSLHVLDVTSWPQERLNAIKSACVSLLHAAGITYTALSGSKTGNAVTVDITSPSSSADAVVTTSNVLTQIQAQETSQAAATQAVLAEEALRKDEETSNPIFGLTWSQIEFRFQGHVDAVTAARDAMNAAANLAGAKTAAIASDNALLAILTDIKRLTRCLRANGALDKSP